MARFGLDSDSESDAPSHSSERELSASHASTTADDDRSSEHSDSDSSQEDAPPRASLYDHDLDNAGDSDAESGTEGSQSAGDDQDDDDDRSMTSASYARPSRSRSQSTRIESLSPRPRRRALPAPTKVPGPPKWSSALRPGRVAVMQASLFGPSPQDESLLRQEDESRDEDDDAEMAPARKQSRSAIGHSQRAYEKQPEQPADDSHAMQEPEPSAPAQSEFRPLRPVSLVPFADSVAAGHESSLVDASLALGRSYRVGFGPQGQVVSLRGAYTPQPLEAGALRIEKLQLAPAAETDKESALRLLRLQLEKTDIYPPASPDLPLSSAPQAVPSESLRFHDFADLFDVTSSRQSGEESEARLFRLGACLFDEIADLALEEVDPASRAYVHALRRRRLVSSWFEDAVAADVEADVSSLPAPSSAAPSASAKRILALLSGHQIESACDSALESSNLRLATLLAQLGPDALATDDRVRADVAEQLRKWREYRIDPFIDDAYRRVLELVSGNLGISQGREDPDPKGDRVRELHVLEGLGWKRAVAMGLWYAAPNGVATVAGADAGLAEVVERYERAYEADRRVATPAPAYLSASASASPSSLPWPPSPASTTPLDPAFHLLKLFASPTHALESALEPRNFGPSPLDYRLPWHLYLLLSRVLQRRDWEDRLEVEELDAEGDDAMMGRGAGRGEQEDATAAVKREGNSVTADRVTEAYAAQLEAMGEWHWAAFVLLHLELEECRIRAIRELLARHVDELEQPAAEADEAEEDAGAPPRNEKLDFLVETLKVPEVWIYSAQADRALASPSTLFRAYTLLLTAERATEAHRIASEDLVPEALVRNDLSLVRRLLEPFLVESAAEPNLEGDVSGWNEGGRVYLLFLSQPGRPDLLSQTVQAVQGLSKRVRGSNRLKSKKLLRLAIAEMESRLMVLAKASPASSALERTQPSLLAASDRAVWIQGANAAFWQGALGGAAAVGA